MNQTYVSDPLCLIFEEKVFDKFLLYSSGSSLLVLGGKSPGTSFFSHTYIPELPDKAPKIHSSGLTFLASL